MPQWQAKRKLRNAARTAPSGIGFKEIVSIIPILHLLCSCVFIFGYSRAFGHKIISLFGVSDVFQVSIRNVIQIYFIVLTPFAVLLLSPAKGSYLERLRVPIATLAGFCAVIVAIVVGTKIDLFFQYTLYVQLSVAVLGALLILQTWWIHRNARRSWNDIGIMASFAGYLLIFSFLVGVHVGLQDASRVLRPRDNYLACIDEQDRSRGALYGRINDRDMVLVIGGTGEYVIGKDICKSFKTVDTHPDGDLHTYLSQIAAVVKRAIGE